MAEEVAAGVAALERVAANAEKWAKTSEKERVALLRKMILATYDNLDRWAVLHARHVTKLPVGEGEGAEAFPNLAEFGHVFGEGYGVGPALFGAYANLLADSLDEYVANGSFPLGKQPAARALGEEKNDHVVRTYPTTTTDSIYAPGFEGYAYLDGSKPLSRGATYEAEREAGTVVVLGAGNFSAPIELLNKMFVEHKVCVYKPNPVNGKVTGPMVRAIFADLIEAGFLEVVEGGVEVGSAMIAHGACDQVMLTGSNKTFDAIVWGSPRDEKEQQRRKDAGEKQCQKQVDAELGNVNVCTVVPGPWTDKEIAHQAAQIAGVRQMNGGHTCPSPQIILLAKDWPQREQFVNKLREKLSQNQATACYYPGTQQKYARFQEHYGDKAEVLEYTGTVGKLDNYLAPLFVSDISSDPELFQNFESFCPVMSDYPMDVEPSAPVFLEAAVDFVNNKTWGNLSTTILACSKTLAEHKPALEKAANDLKVGAVGINVWGGNIVFFSQLRWGAFPGNTAEDVQSGVGLGVGNYYMYDNMKKAVLWSPCVSPVHLKSYSNPTKGATLMRRLAYFAAWPSVWNLVKLISIGVLGV